MKKVILILLIVLCVFVSIIALLAGFNMETSYAKKLTFENDNQVLALAYISDGIDTVDYTIPNKYYSKQEIEQFDIVDLGGYEYYLVVPRYKGKVTISYLTMTEDGGTTATFVKEVTKPFFLRCNMSDIFSNVEIKFEYKDKEYKYSPYISLKDGSVVTEDFVMLLK